MRIMTWMCVALALAAIAAVPYAATAEVLGRVTTGSVVVSGNTLTNFDLSVENGKVYADDVQIWPSPMTKPRQHVGPTGAAADSSLLRRQQRTTAAVNSTIRDLRAQGVAAGSIPALRAASYRMMTDAVDTAWVASCGTAVWVKWKGWYAEEISVDSSPGPLGKDLPHAVAETMRFFLERGGKVYVGDGYLDMALEQRAQSMDAKLASVMSGGIASEGVPYTFKHHHRNLIRDLRTPVPLSRLRTKGR